ncbi:MAG TPA: HDIG domain-containing protein [Rubrobacteraceae bacterium]|nr:HDIG domain-containing protein [Rubrobacteraceae bacterium]
MTPQNNSSGSGKPANELRRPATWFERFRSWVESLPKARLYVALLLITWASLTILISIDTRTLSALGLWRGETGYRVGTVAQDDVFAPRNVTYEDPAATEQARTQAAESVPEVYRQSSEVPEQVVGDVRGYFAEVRDIRNSDASTEEKISNILDMTPFYLPDSLARQLVFLDSGEVDDAERYVVENLRELYDSASIADNDVENAPASVISLAEARGRLSEAARRDASGDIGALVEALSRGFLEPNYVIDRQATQEARQAAASEVEPVTRTIQQNERVIARGEVIDQEDLAQLEALRVNRDSNPWTVFLGVGLVVAAEMGMAWYFLERFGSRILRTNAIIRVILAASLTILFTALARLFITLSLDPYLTPLAGLSIIGTLLLGPRLMFLMVVVTSVNIGIIAGNDFYLTAALLLASGFAIYTVVRVSSRTQLLKAGLFVAAVTSGVTFAVSLVGGSVISGALWQGLVGLANGLLSLMLAMVLLPLLENAFNILTPMKLLELSDPGRPLLHKLLQKAPGTFSHSMMVGNLAENAAERIGADALLARVGAYYHDVGKLEHPAYFIENQISQMNPHKELTASLSARIIRRHVKDGLEIGRNWGLPEEILEIIAQHHGSTRIEYFYRKAIEEALDGEVVREADFRYSSGLPQSKEAGIVMLADSVEATVKSIPNPTPKRIEDVIADTIKQKLDDGQFDECKLTMHEIHEVGEAIREALIGFLGPRIEYPDAPQTAKASSKTGSKSS